MIVNLRWTRWFLVLWMMGLLATFAPPALHAQDQATIVGTVTDQSGAVIPNARITVSNPAKGYVRNLVSNSVGAYVAAKVPIGGYVITAAAPGFEKLVRNGITLQVGELLRVDLRLQVGRATQLVTITGNVPKVQTDTGAISNVITGTQITDLDLNGRGFENLYLLVPGVSEANGVTFTTPTSEQITFDGLRSSGNRTEINGVSNTDMGAGGISNDVVPSIDSIAEFSINDNAAGADVGYAGSSLVELATKSGTQQFHGDAYEFNRNTVFNSNDFFQNRVVNPPGGNAPKTPLIWNDPGYTFGGPFYIPGVYNTDKSKTFFFWSQEFHRYRTGSVINTTVPSLLERQGNFSQCDKTSPNYNTTVASGCILPKNPATGALYPGDIVPVSPDATDLLNAFVPLPNSGPEGFVSSPISPTNWDQEQIRVDQNISDKTSAFVSFIHDAWYFGYLPPANRTTTGLGPGPFDTVEEQEHRLSFNTSIHVAHTFNPRLMNQIVLGYTEDGLFFVKPLAGPASVADSIDKPANWTGGNIFAEDASNPALPGVDVSGGAPGFEMSSTDEPNGNDAAPTFTVKDDLVGVVGNHTLKTGFELVRFQKNELGGFFTQGYLFFSGGSFPGSTGNGLADMDIGAIDQFEQGVQTVNGTPVGGYPKYYFRNSDFEPYFQDDWKATRKLTLNLGARYYWFQPLHEVSNPPKNEDFIPSLYNPAAQAQLNASGDIVEGTGDWFDQFGNGLVDCGTGGIPAGCTKGTYGTVAPRFGFAYDPTGSGKTAIRGGYGIFYDIGPGGSGYGAAAEALESNPPTDFVSSGFDINGYQNIAPGKVGPASLSTLPTVTKWTGVQQFNLTVQHEFPGNNLLSVAYVGTLAHHLPIEDQLEQIPIGVTTENVPELAGTAGCTSSGNCNVQSILIKKQHAATFFAPYRGYSSISEYENVGNSNYTALQAQLTHPFGHGLLFQAAYTWSHWLDDGTAATYACIDSTDQERCYATSDYNRPQSLVLNYVYSLPFFLGSSHKFLSESLGGWRISGITSFISGLPLTPGCGVSGYATGIGGGVDCNSVGTVGVQKGTINIPTYGPTPSFINGATYAQPLESQLAANEESGMFGYMGRNVISGPGRNDWDLALLKDFSLPWFGAEHSRLEFRLETFNTFNHPQFDGVTSGCSGNTGFGQTCTGLNNASLGSVDADWPARVLQLGLKLSF